MVARTWTHAFGAIQGCDGNSQNLNGSRNPHDFVRSNFLTPLGRKEESDPVSAEG
jgi:hypothetical protein